MALSFNLGYQESISVHPTRRQNFAGKPYSNFPNIWQWLIWRSHASWYVKLETIVCFWYIKNINSEKILPHRVCTSEYMYIKSIKTKKKRHYNIICDVMSTWSIITFLPVWTHYWQYTIQPPFISYILWSLISSLFWFCHFWHYLSQFSCAYQTERWYQVVRISDIHLIFLSISHLQFYNICF